MTGNDSARKTPQLQYDSVTGDYVVQHDPSEEPELSVTVAYAVADVVDCEPAELELNAVVHPDALNSLFGHRYDGTPRKGGELSFELAGCGVTVHADGEIRIDPA